MSLFTVDPEKCKRDGICVAECPALLLELKDDKEAVPVPIDEADEFCITCGHCVAVCPHGALSHRAMSPEQCPPVKKEWLLGKDHVEHFLRARRSIRTYKDKPVDKETLSKLIDIARYAPSGSNLQPVEWLVIHDGDEVQKLAGMVVDWMRYMIKEKPEVAEPMRMDRIVESWEDGVDRICRGAPHVIVTHAPKDLPPALSACTIALTYLDLAAPSFALGACWAGYFNYAATFWPPMIEALALPEGNISHGAMMVGYPKYKYHRLPLRNEAPITWR